VTLAELFAQSLPICVVVTLVMVALEEDEPRPYLKHAARYFATLYGGIIAFALALYAIDHAFA